MANSTRKAAYNLSLSVYGYGTWRGYCTQVGHGMSVVQVDGSSRSRRGRAFYMTRTTSGSFGLTLLLESEARLREFNAWMETYARLVTNPDGQAKAMTVSLPSRNFLKVAVPNGLVARHGWDSDRITYSLSLLFVGTRDPLDNIEASEAIASFIPARYDLTEAPWFYPASTPLGGGDAVEDSLYRDQAHERRAIVNIDRPRGGVGTARGVV